MKQEVRQRKKQKPQEQMLAFDPAKVFDPADAKRGELEDLAASLKSDLDSSNYLARKGQGGDRSKYDDGGGPREHYLNNRVWMADP